MTEMRTAPRTPNEALQSCSDQAAHGPQFGVGLCKMQARLRYLVPSDGTPDATTAWKNARYKKATDDPSTAPRGAFHFWTGGSSGHGHVTIARGGSPDWSTDIKRAGFYDATTVEHINATWPTLHYVGWSLDIDGVLCVPGKLDLFEPKPKPVRPIPLERRVRIIHQLARTARRNGSKGWARRLNKWAEKMQARIDRKAHKGAERVSQLP